MTERVMSIFINYAKVAPEAIDPLVQIERYIQSQLVDLELPETKQTKKLDKKLLELVKIRVSQINQCAYCIDMHTKDARAIGETEQRLYGLSAWRETPYYSKRERAALAWSEALTTISERAVKDTLREELSEYFDEKSIVDLSLAICNINTWNRFSVSLGAKVGSYQIGQHE